MKIATRYTFFLLLLVAGAGLFMRALPYLQIHLDYINLRHAHSHLAFLGWVYSTLFLVFVRLFLRPNKFTTHFYRLFWLTQISVAGMSVSFLLQGYGPVSIAFLTLHTLLAYRFIWKFWNLWQPDWKSASTWFGSAALLFFLLSTLGPFAIPPIKILGNSNPLWMKMAVNYYLHFQYNGWFTFGVLALLFKVMEDSSISYPRSWASWQFRLMAAALLPTYFVTLTSSGLPGWTANFATVGVWLQWIGFALFSYIFLTKKMMHQISGSNISKFILGFALTMLFLKITFELIGATPPFSAYFTPFSQFLIIGYLHLVFLGTVTPFLWWVNAQSGFLYLQNSWTRIIIIIYSLGFGGSEVALMMFGLNKPLPHSTLLLLIFSGLLFLSTTGILYLISGKVKIDSSMTEPNLPKATLQPEFSEQ